MIISGNRTIETMGFKTIGFGAVRKFHWNTAREQPFKNKAFLYE